MGTRTPTPAERRVLKYVAAFEMVNRRPITSLQQMADVIDRDKSTAETHARNLRKKGLLMLEGGCWLVPTDVRERLGL